MDRAGAVELDAASHRAVLGNAGPAGTHCFGGEDRTLDDEHALVMAGGTPTEQAAQSLHLLIRRAEASHRAIVSGAG